MGDRARRNDQYRRDSQLVVTDKRKERIMQALFLLAELCLVGIVVLGVWLIYMPAALIVAGGVGIVMMERAVRT